MKFSFENQGTHTYLVYTVAEDDAVDSMSLGMLTNNKIHGLAHTLFTQMDATKFIKYDVSAKISVKQFFTGQVNKKRLIGVFNGIIDAMLSAEDYMIDVNSIILDLDYIFADVSTCETVLVCLPIVSDDLSNRDLGAFFKNIMFTTQFDQTENCDHVAKIINYLNSSPVFSLVDFKKLLDSIDGTVANEQVQKTVVHKPQVQQMQTPVQQSPVKQPAPPKSPVQQPVQNPVVRPVINQSNVQTPPVQAVPVQQGTPEKKSSIFGWLEKRQKTEKKPVKTSSNVPPALQQKIQTKQDGFEIPGQQSVNQGFAIPGQPTPPPAASPVSQGQPLMGAAQTPNKPVQPQAYNSFTKPQNPASAPQPAPVQPVQPVAPAPQIQSAPQSKPMNFGETTVLNAGGTFGETTVLNAGMMQQEVKIQPYLIRSKNNERIELNKPVFRIGKEKSYVDYFIGDNTAISRSHANIISRDGAYFVVDTNSTNHTYVNGAMIQSNVETEISDGAQIRLANEDFQFKLR